jgi:hypothetical protein
MACFKNANPITGFGMFEPDVPDVPSYGKQMESALGAQIKLMPALYEAERTWGPKFTDLAIQNMNRYLGSDGQPGLLDTYGRVGQRMGEIESDIASAQRGRDIGDVRNLGPEALAAMRGWNPQQTELMDALNAQALEQVELGGRMTPDQMRMIQNSVMGQRSNMGWGYNPGDMAQAAMSARGYSDQLQQARMRQAQLQAGQNQNIYGDPFMQVLGRQGQAYGSMGGATMAGAQGSQNVGPNLFSPESQMQYDIWNTGFQGQLGANIAGSNNNAALFGALLGAGGQMGGAGICFVARAIYGDANPKWLEFAYWLKTRAPHWFYCFYRDYGPGIGAWLRRKSWVAQRLRPWIKRWMDGRINTVNSEKEVAHG